MTPFAAKLIEFQRWADTLSPEFSRAVRQTVHGAYPAAFGETPAANNVVNNLTNLIETASNAYLQSVGAYYTAKGKVADLKLAARGSYATQAINAAQGAASLPPSNLWLIGGLGALALIVLMRK